MKRIILLSIIISLMFGCVHSGEKSTGKVELFQPEVIKGEGELVSVPSGLRILNITEKDENSKGFLFCAEPFSDVALSDTFRLINSFKSNGTDSSRELETNATALELAGRTQVVLLAREFLYRTCEAAANGWLDASAVKLNHVAIIIQISSMLEQDANKEKVVVAEGRMKQLKEADRLANEQVERLQKGLLKQGR